MCKLSVCCLIVFDYVLGFVIMVLAGIRLRLFAVFDWLVVVCVWVGLLC